jgi:hypothetical protein
LILLTWIWGALIVTLFLTPAVSVLYDTQGFSWGYSMENFGPNMPPIEMGVTISQLCLAGILYLLIIPKLIFVVS